MTLHASMKSVLEERAARERTRAFAAGLRVVGTVADLRAGRIPGPLFLYLDGHGGVFEEVVLGYREGWVRCPRANGGFGISYCVSDEERIYARGEGRI